jgi:hypothetical protein
MNNDIRTTRLRQERFEEILDARGSASLDCSYSLALKTTVQKSYPTAAASYFACLIVQYEGPETEGGSATAVTPYPNNYVWALNEGSQIPPVGTIVTAHAVGGRWVFLYDVPAA